MKNSIIVVAWSDQGEGTDPEALGLVFTKALHALMQIVKLLQIGLICLGQGGLRSPSASSRSLYQTACVRACVPFSVLKYRLSQIVRFIGFYRYIWPKTEQQPNLFGTKNRLPSGQDIRHCPIRLYCSWPLPRKQTKRQSIWNTYQCKGVDCRACRKKGSESLVISPLVPFATCKLD